MADTDVPVRSIGCGRPHRHDPHTWPGGTFTLGCDGRPAPPSDTLLAAALTLDRIQHLARAARLDGLEPEPADDALATIARIVGQVAESLRTTGGTRLRDQILSADEAAVALGLSSNAVRGRCRSGELDAAQLGGGAWAISAASVASAPGAYGARREPETSGEVGRG